jgi:uncharacterized protein YcaQ
VSAAGPREASRLRRLILGRTLVEAPSLGAAVARLGFVQADPIRAPARAQDLILRHRVAGYRVGDLEREYPGLGLDEDVVYAYGFVPPATRALLHPRAGMPGEGVPSGLAAEVLAYVRDRGLAHPRELGGALGHHGEANAWGGTSRATTRALEHLHYWGHLRVARRDAGVRVYEPAPVPAPEPLAPEERARRLVLLISELLGPLPEPSLRGVVRLARYAMPGVEGRTEAISRLLTLGALERASVDGVAYVGQAGWVAGDGDEEPPDEVRLLAPFDPVVWDRRRVEHLWGWAYRFEAYTPAPRRQFGYYALPMLWGARLVGWANLTARAGALDVDVGFVERRPRDRGFARALEAEVARVRDFLFGPASRRPPRRAAAGRR